MHANVYLLICKSSKCCFSYIGISKLYTYCSSNFVVCLCGLYLRGSTALKHIVKNFFFVLLHVFNQKLVYFDLKQVLRHTKYCKLLSFTFFCALPTMQST